MADLRLPWYRRAAYALTGTRFMRAVAGPKFFAPLDRWLLEHSRLRRRINAGGDTASVLLTTTGRRSGLPRAVALVAQRDGDDLVVVASNWGRTGHPAWSENLLAEPRAHVDGSAGSYDVVARLCDPDEKQRRWPALVTTMPMWDRYTAVTDRDLRVFVLTRASGA